MSRLVLGVLGERITYSLSPRIFEWAFRATGVDGEYRLFDLPVDKARNLLRSRDDWTGLNVTTPYKKLAYEMCANLFPEARVTAAVNTVVRSAGGIDGHNTDVSGFRFALSESAESTVQPRLALVIGSGGAARAVILALSRMYNQLRIEVASREPQQARLRLAPLIQSAAVHSVIDTETAAHFAKDFDLVVQATPVGSASMPGCPLREPLNFRDSALVMDLIYSPRKTRFLEYAEASGSRIQNGLHMLISQAAESFRIWTGIEFPLDEAVNALLPELAAE